MTALQAALFVANHKFEPLDENDRDMGLAGASPDALKYENNEDQSFWTVDTGREGSRLQDRILRIERQNFDGTHDMWILAVAMEAA